MLQDIYLDNALNEYLRLYKEKSKSECNCFLIDALRCFSNDLSRQATAIFSQLVELNLREHPDADELHVKWCMGVALFWKKTPIPVQVPDELLKALAYDFYDLTNHLEGADDCEKITANNKMVRLYDKLSNLPEVRNRIEFDYGAYHRSRAGLHWRDDDEEISLDQLKRRFMFRRVEFASKLDDRDKKELLNLAYDAMNDLCAVIGVPPEYISFRGELSIGFGLKGSKNAAAQYEPDKKLLNMTRARYGGTLAHEWFHAFDYYNGTGNSFASEMTPNQVWKEFISGLTITDYFKRCEGFSVSRGNSYWNNTVEKCARGFETYTWTEMKKRGWCNNYLVSRIKPWKDDDDATFPYPFEDEQEIFTLYDNLIKKTADGNR